VTLTAADDDSGRRLDRILRKALPDTPLSALHRLIRKGRVLVNGKAADAADRIHAGDVITLPDPAISDKMVITPPARIKSATGALKILFEGSGLLVLNKPPGLAVHGPDKDNLDARVKAYLEGKIPPSLSFTPGPLHRLDKPTSGIVVFSANLEGALAFSKLLREGKVRKTYLAILEGSLTTNAVWEDMLVRDKSLHKSIIAFGDTAKKAITKVTPAARSVPPQSDPLTLAFLEPETGRTHQLRAQAAFHGHPLWRDRKYGASGSGGFFLHALFLEIPALPRISAELPEAFASELTALFPGINIRNAAILLLE
jgi:23S rRNA pseudouridine955/2504/2580 synthase